jgi:hypothetical protein
MTSEAPANSEAPVVNRVEMIKGFMAQGITETADLVAAAKAQNFEITPMSVNVIKTHLRGHRKHS